MPQIRVKRTEIKAGTIDDPERKVIMAQYQVGEQPPRFVYIPKAEYTKEREAEEIKKDIESLAKVTEETIEL